MGSFLVSALLHDLGMWGLGRGTEFKSVGGFFLVNGLGIVLERAYTKLTGERLEGHIWTLLWVVVTGQFLVDAWVRRGLVGSWFMPESLRPGKALLEYAYHNVTLVRNGLALLVPNS
jgi:hypothetical protein